MKAPIVLKKCTFPVSFFIIFHVVFILYQILLSAYCSVASSVVFNIKYFCCWIIALRTEGIYIYSLYVGKIFSFHV